MTTRRELLTKVVQYVQTQPQVSGAITVAATTISLCRDTEARAGIIVPVTVRNNNGIPFTELVQTQPMTKLEKVVRVALNRHGLPLRLYSDKQWRNQNGEKIFGKMAIQVGPWRNASSPPVTGSQQLPQHHWMILSGPSQRMTPEGPEDIPPEELLTRRNVLMGPRVNISTHRVMMTLMPGDPRMTPLQYLLVYSHPDGPYDE
jgi:hypothetical protein